MIKLLYHPVFKKEYKKLPKAARIKFGERIKLFVQNTKQELLYDHSLKGSLQGKRAFSVTGDIRVIYKYIDEATIMLLRIGTHNQVY